MPTLPYAQEIERIRFGPAELKALMNELDARESRDSQAAHDRRAEARVRCRSFGILTLMSGPRYGTAYMIPLRNISSGGVAFLFDGSMETGTRCTFRIVSPDGNTLDAAGRIVRCAPIRDGAFEIALQLDEPVDLDLAS